MHAKYSSGGGVDFDKEGVFFRREGTDLKFPDFGTGVIFFTCFLHTSSYLEVVIILLEEES